MNNNPKQIYASMIFWCDGLENSTRIQNAQYCWPLLKQLCDHINNSISSHQISCHLFDFSPTQIISDSIHIPYPKGSFQKTQKLNTIIFNYAHQHDYLMMFDSDVFFEHKDFHTVSQIIGSIENNDIITFDVAKLEQFDTNIYPPAIDRTSSNWMFAYGGYKENGPFGTGGKGGLGGVYVVDLSLLQSINGFNEKYTVWGGEDGEALARLYDTRTYFNLKPQKDTYAFHIPHFCDYANINYWHPGKNKSCSNHV